MDRVVRSEGSMAEERPEMEEALLDLRSVAVEPVLGRPVSERRISSGIFSSRVSSRSCRTS